MKKTLELKDLQDMLISTCILFNRPIHKNMLIKIVTDIYECNTYKEVDFAIIDLIEKKLLCEYKHLICTPEYFSNWDKQFTVTDEGIIRFLFSLKEDIKNYLFFSPYAAEQQITPHTFFRYVDRHYPALISSDAALKYFEQFDDTFPYGLNNTFYAEFNDYPTKGFLTTFFNNTDCRIFISHMEMKRNYVNLGLILIPDNKKSYKKANEQFEAFKNNIISYFDKDIKINIKKTPLTMIIGNKF